MSMQWVDKTSGKTTISGTAPSPNYLPVYMVEVVDPKHGMITYRSTIPDFVLDVLNKFFLKDMGRNKITIIANDPDLLLLNFYNRRKDWEFIIELAKACPYFLVESDSEEAFLMSITYDESATPSENLNIKIEDVEIEDLNQGKKGLRGRNPGKKKTTKPPRCEPGPGPPPEPKPDPDKWVKDNDVNPSDGSQPQGDGDGKGSGQGQGQGQGQGKDKAKVRVNLLIKLAVMLPVQEKAKALERVMEMAKVLVKEENLEKLLEKVPMEMEEMEKIVKNAPMRLKK